VLCGWCPQRLPTTTFLPCTVFLYHGGLKALAIAEGRMRRDNLVTKYYKFIFLGSDDIL
jgi:hypothetical protein